MSQLATESTISRNGLAKDPRQPPRCVLIGSTGMAARCGELLLARGFDLFGVFTDDTRLRRWAEDVSRPCWPIDDAVLGEQLAATSFDFLFSIVNDHPLSSELLALPRQAAINYHDSPLPTYAGLNAPAWAILNGEPEHGVCWCLMTPTLDAGDLLQEQRFSITEQETTRSLNLRCTEAGLSLFETLVDDILTHQLQPSPQDLSKRTYYSRTDRPFAGGYLRWDQSAAAILRLIRALDFGPVDNPLGLPKLIIDGQLNVVVRASITEAPANATPRPGLALLDRTDDSLIVRCQDAWLRLEDLQPVNTSANAQQAADEPEKIQAQAVSDTALDLSHDQTSLERLDELARASARVEQHWINWWRQAATIALPLVPERPTTDHHNATTPATNACQQLEPAPHANALHPFAMMLLFLARLTSEERISISLQLRPSVGEWQPCFLEVAPFQARISLDAPLARAIAQAQAALEEALRLPPPSADLSLRYPDLKTHSTPALTVAVDEQTVRWRDQGELPAPLLRALYQVFCQHLEGLRADPDALERCCLADVELTTDAQRRQMLGWSAAQSRPFDLSQSYIAQFAARLPAHADRIAVRSRDQQLTYAELSAQAAAVAGRLSELALPENSLIAVAAEREIALIPVLLGIFAAGHAYLPLEAERYPTERLRQMLDDAEVALSIALSDQGAAALSAASNRQVADGRELVKIPSHSEQPASDTGLSLGPFLRHQNAEAIAYLIFTSGSTGAPKGVEVSQRSLVNHNLAAIDLFGLSAQDRVLQLGALGFDLSLEEIFPTLLTGACLVLLPEGIKESAHDFFHLLRAEAITVLDLPTAFWHAMVAMLEHEAAPDTLRLVVIGGEKASIQHAERFQRLAPRVRLLNTYGPTETTIIATASEDLGTIGHPIANVRAYVLDGVGQLCPPGMIGELVIGGQAVACGYRHRDELNAQSFVADPFATAIEQMEQAAGSAPKTLSASARRMYRTGDRASFTNDGELRFFGRNDGQVKINGFRIETDEIRQASLAHPGVADAAVIPIKRSGHGDANAAVDLACYFVVNGAAELDLSALRAHLQAALPSYMVPRYLVPVDAIPLNANGKVDQSALPLPEPASSEPSGGGCLNPEIDSTLELQLAAALRSALGVQAYQPDASFDELGGDSLSAIQFLLELEKLTGQQVPVELLYRTPSMSALAQELERKNDQSWSPLVTLRLGDEQKPPLFLIHTTPGDLLGYINLVRHLDDRTVYGIQARGLDLAAKPAQTISAMATDYVAILLERQPSGPIYLSGWCFGGIVATEMVAQLERTGRAVALFAPIETWGQPAPSLRAKLNKLANLITWGPRGWISFARSKLGRLRGTASVEDQDLDALDFISQRFGSTRSMEELERMKWLYRINTKAADQYLMPHIATRVDLLMIKPEAEFGRIPDKTYWWRDIAAHRHLQLFNGDHATVLKEPAVAAVGAALVALMQQVDRAPEQQDGPQS